MNTPKRAACEKTFFVSESNLTRFNGSSLWKPAITSEKDLMSLR